MRRQSHRSPLHDTNFANARMNRSKLKHIQHQVRANAKPIFRLFTGFEEILARKPGVQTVLEGKMMGLCPGFGQRVKSRCMENRKNKESCGGTREAARFRAWFTLR